MAFRGTAPRRSGPRGPCGPLPHFGVAPPSSVTESSCFHIDVHPRTVLFTKLSVSQRPRVPASKIRSKIERPLRGNEPCSPDEVAASEFLVTSARCKADSLQSGHLKSRVEPWAQWVGAVSLTEDCRPCPQRHRVTKQSQKKRYCARFHAGLPWSLRASWSLLGTQTLRLCLTTGRRWVLTW